MIVGKKKFSVLPINNSKKGLQIPLPMPNQLSKKKTVQQGIKTTMIIEKDMFITLVFVNHCNRKISQQEKQTHNNNSFRDFFFHIILFFTHFSP